MKASSEFRKIRERFTGQTLTLVIKPSSDPLAANRRYWYEGGGCVLRLGRRNTDRKATEKPETRKRRKALVPIAMTDEQYQLVHFK